MSIDFISTAIALLKPRRAQVDRGIVFALLLVLAAAVAFPALAALPVVSEARVAHHDRVTRIALSVSSPVRYQVFSLDGPHRAVIDLPDVLWTTPAVLQPVGLFVSLRRGRFKPGAFRVVIECREGFTIGNSALTASDSGGYQLIVELVAATTVRASRPTASTKAVSHVLADDGAAFKTPKVGGAKITPVVGATGLALGDIGPARSATIGGMPSGAASVGATTIAPVRPRPRPPAAAAPSIPQWVVAIDPGHGGQDPGAISLGGDYEKRITLASARALRDELTALGRYRVVLTRNGDRFIRLRDRIAIARAAGADIFVSLHADTIPNEAVRGLSVYTLSERASDAEAAALAERENKVDLIAGVKLVGETPEVSTILIDLIQRETMNDSARFASLLVEELEQQTTLLPRTHRFAGFAVLKAPDVPSVLVELGYLSNESDQRMLLSSSYRRKLARGIAHAIDRYFVRVEARRH